MSGDLYGPEQELDDRLAVIAVCLDHFVGVGEAEHLLVGLLEFLESGRIDREHAVETLGGLVGAWPGAHEVLEFCMRKLRWPEIKELLVAHVAADADFRTRDLAASVLEAYEEEWPGGEIYRAYRT